MITGVFGLTGAGKSTFLAWCSNRALRGKRIKVGLSLAGGVELTDTHPKFYEKVYSNFPMIGCYPLDWDKLGVYDYHNCLILIDEIMMLCDSRAFKTYPENIKYFMSHHRKYDTDIIWCSQSYRDTDLRIRSLSKQFLLMERGVTHTRVTPIRHCMDVKNGQIDDWYETGGVLASKFLNRKKFYHLFDTKSRKVLLPLEDEILWDMG